MFTEKEREKDGKEANIFFKIIVALQQKMELKILLKFIFYLFSFSRTLQVQRIFSSS